MEREIKISEHLIRNVSLFGLVTALITGGIIAGEQKDSGCIGKIPWKNFKKGNIIVCQHEDGYFIAHGSGILPVTLPTSVKSIEHVWSLQDYVIEWYEDLAKDAHAHHKLNILTGEKVDKYFLKP